jgi:hypothetical protein
MTLFRCTCQNVACEAAPHMGRPRCTSSATVDVATPGDVTTRDSGVIYGPLEGWSIDGDGRSGRCKWCVIVNS